MPFWWKTDGEKIPAKVHRKRKALERDKALHLVFATQDTSVPAEAEAKVAATVRARRRLTGTSLPGSRL